MLATAITDAEKNAYEVALENFDLAANALELEDNVRAMIKYPERDPLGERSGPDGYRKDRPVRRIPRAAQHPARSGQGRHPLSTRT